MNAILDRGQNALQQAEVIVTKIGGENACEFQENFQRISSNPKKQLIAISALRAKVDGKEYKTTDKLIEITKLAEAGDSAALEKLAQLKQFHIGKIQEKVEPEFHGAMIGCLNESFDAYEEHIEELLETRQTVQTLGEDYLYKDKSGKDHSLIGFGEKVVENLYVTYFELKGKESTVLKDDVWMQSVLNGNPVEALRLQRSTIGKLRKAFKKSVQEALENPSNIVITGGYKPGIAFKRSYTDLTAAELARASQELGKKTVLGVEKADPILSADPRKIDDTSQLKVINDMSWQMGSELFGIKGAQAGAVHPDVMDTLQGTGVDIVVYDPKNPEGRSTFISESLAREMDTKVVIATKNIPSTVIVRGAMSRAKGVLATIAVAFRDFVLDQTYSSENIWVVTTNDPVNTDRIEKLERTLKRKYGKSFSVEARADLALVLAIGGGQANGYSDALNAAGIHAPFKNGVEEAQSTGYIVPEDKVRLAVNTMHTHAYAS